MYSGFLNESLTKNSKLFEYFKLGIDSFAPNWESEYSTNKSQEIFTICDKFFNSCYHKYDENELLFIYNQIYNLAGFEDSVKIITEFLNIKIDLNFNHEDLTISLTLESDLFKDPTLSMTYFNELVRDLLFFKSIDVEIAKISINVSVINKLYNIGYQNSIVNEYFTRENMFIGED